MKCVLKALVCGPWAGSPPSRLSSGIRKWSLNGGPAQQLTPAFSFSVHCDSQEEIDQYWERLIAGGKAMACGWLTDCFGVSWQIVPRNLGELIRHPKGMQAMMGMIKLQMATLEAAAREG